MVSYWLESPTRKKKILQTSALLTLMLNQQRVLKTNGLLKYARQSKRLTARSAVLSLRQCALTFVHVTLMEYQLKPRNNGLTFSQILREWLCMIDATKEMQVVRQRKKLFSIKELRHWTRFWQRWKSSRSKRTRISCSVSKTWKMVGEIPDRCLKKKPKNLRSCMTVRKCRVQWT